MNFLFGNKFFEFQQIIRVILFKILFCFSGRLFYLQYDKIKVNRCNNAIKYLLSTVLSTYIYPFVKYWYQNGMINMNIQKGQETLFLIKTYGKAYALSGLNQGISLDTRLVFVSKKGKYLCDCVF